MYDDCMTNVELFSNGPIEGNVRVIMDERGVVWLVLTDMAKILEYSTTAHAVRLLKPHQYRSATEEERDRLGISGGRAPYLITEGGFYRLAVRSSRPEAEPFQDWVEEEVLPSIRKEGGYIRKDATDEQVEELKRKHQLQLEGMNRRIKQHEYLVNKEATLLDNERRERISNLEGQVALESAYSRYVEDYVGAYGTTKDMMTKAKFKKERFS